MTPKPHTKDRRSIWRVGPESTWTTVLPVTFIIVSLLSLVVLPLVVAWHTARMRDEISRVAASDWARTANRLPGEERTARWLVRQAMHEGVHHLGDIRTILAQLG